MTKSKLANNYLAKRELSAQTVKAFNLGYANSESTSLYQLLLSKKFEINDILESGLVKKSNKNQNIYIDKIIELDKRFEKNEINEEEYKILRENYKKNIEG